MEKMQRNKMKKLVLRMKKLDILGKHKKLGKLVAKINPNIILEDPNNDLYNHTSLLMNLVIMQSGEAVKKIIEAGASVNYRDKWGNTALIFAASESDNLKFAKMLVQGGADIDAYNSVGMTALGIAKEKKNYRVVKYLQSAGAKKEVEEAVRKKYKDDKARCNHEKFFNGNPEELSKKYSMNFNNEDVKTSDSMGYTVLHILAGGGLFKGVLNLIKLGADVNTRAEDGKTPLMLAAQYWRIPVLRKLIVSGADLNAQDADGKTALILAIEKYRDNEFYSFGERQNCSSTEFYNKQKLSEVVQIFCAYGADLNLQDKNGETALILALKKRLLDTAYKLLSYNADASFRDKDGTSALTEALWIEEKKNNEGFFDSVDKFFNKIAGIDTDVEQIDPLAHNLLVHALIQAGADVNLPGKDGRTPLRLARDFELSEIERHLVILGAKEI